MACLSAGRDFSAKFPIFPSANAALRRAAALGLQSWVAHSTAVLCKNLGDWAAARSTVQSSRPAADRRNRLRIMEVIPCVVLARGESLNCIEGFSLGLD